MDKLKATAFVLLVPLILIHLPSLANASGSVYSVAYIYSTDLSSAEDYRAHLLSYGITVDLVSNASAETWDFSGYGLIIVGSDTGDGYDWWPKSGVPVIDGAGKPILGLGRGGSSFFSELGLFIDWGQGWLGFKDSIYVVDVAHRIFNYPMSVAIPPSRIIQLYTSTGHIGIYLPSPEPGVTPLGRESDNVDHYPLIQEDTRYVLWGFTNSPADMTQTGKDLFINTVLWLLGWVAPGSFSAAFIYSTDLPAAQSYQSLLEAHGIAVDLVLNSSTPTWDFSGYGLIIVGSDTGHRYDWWPKSGVPVIDGAGKPILGLGRGGSSFFSELGLFIDWGQGWIGFKDSIYVVDVAHQIFHFPTDIAIPPSRIIQLYTSTGHIGIYLPSPEPGVTPLGRESDNVDHYPLIQEDTRYVLWGFTNSPADMTQTGKDLFVNIVLWLQGSVIPEFPSTLILFTLLSTISAIVIISKQTRIRRRVTQET